ncbi:MAG: hypothetical protein NE334_01875 [Lentisphaeraceae bacterium]|nr:hypothetical protein [Lentisphaeraceae bacterium]
MNFFKILFLMITCLLIGKTVWAQGVSEDGSEDSSNVGDTKTWTCTCKGHTSYTEEKPETPPNPNTWICTAVCEGGLHSGYCAKHCAICATAHATFVQAKQFYETQYNVYQTEKNNYEAIKQQVEDETEKFSIKEVVHLGKKEFLASARTDLSQVIVQIAELVAHIAALQNNLNGLQHTKVQLEAQIAAATDDNLIIALQAQLQVTVNQIATLEPQIEGLEVTKNALEETVEPLTEAVEDALNDAVSWFDEHIMPAVNLIDSLVTSAVNIAGAVVSIISTAENLKGVAEGKFDIWSGERSNHPVSVGPAEFNVIVPLSSLPETVQPSPKAQ